MKRKSDKNKLVKKFLEHRKWDDYKLALGKKSRGRGVYVLYKDEKIYYIGLSKSSLRSRLRQHATKDRHKSKWNNFSFYQIGKAKYIKDSESLMLRIFRPIGNRISGKFNRKYNIARKFIR